MSAPGALRAMLHEMAQPAAAQPAAADQLATLRGRVAPAGGAAALRIHLAGGAAPDAALRPWLDLLRAAGARLACRPARAELDGHGPTRRLWIEISLPPASG